MKATFSALVLLFSVVSVIPIIVMLLELAVNENKSILANLLRNISK